MARLVRALSVLQAPDGLDSFWADFTIVCADFSTIFALYPLSFNAITSAQELKTFGLPVSHSAQSRNMAP